MSRIAKKNLQKVFLIIDKRERENVRKVFIDTIGKRFDVREENRGVGDFWICSDNEDGVIVPELIIERKTWSDYISSLRTNRIYDQRRRLIETCTRCAFLIEGDKGTAASRATSPLEQLEKFLHHSQVRDGIAVLYTETLDYSVNLIVHFMEKLRDKTWLKSKNGAKTFNECQKLNKKSGMNPENCYCAQLAQCPGISPAMAKTISNSYSSMVSLCLAIDKDIMCVVKEVAAMRLTNEKKSKRFGEKRAKCFVEYIAQKKVVIPPSSKKRKRYPLSSKTDIQLGNESLYERYEL